MLSVSVLVGVGEVNMPSLLYITHTLINASTMDEKNGHYHYVTTVFNSFHGDSSVILVCNNGYSGHGITIVIFKITDNGLDFNCDGRDFDCDD